MSELCWVNFVDNDMIIVWWGECIDVDNVMMMDDNLALRKWVPRQKSVSPKWPMGLVWWGIFPSITPKFWLWMACQSVKNYFLRSLMTFQCIWDGLLMMVKFWFMRQTMSEMVGRNVSYLKPQGNLSLVVGCN